jgi:hypothetical protein
MTRREKYFNELEVRKPNGTICLFHDGVVRFRVFYGVIYRYRFKPDRMRSGLSNPHIAQVTCPKLIGFVRMRFFPEDVGL